MEVLFIVRKENPREIRYTIQEDNVISLILVIALEWLIAVNQYKLDLNIMILYINICVPVVCDSMLQFPEVYIAPKRLSEYYNRELIFVLRDKELSPASYMLLNQIAARLTPKSKHNRILIGQYG